MNKTRIPGGGIAVKLTPADLRRMAHVVGTCKCGKPAQVSRGGKGADGKWTFEEVCFDCSEPAKTA
jgi:hypothetical protein